MATTTPDDFADIPLDDEAGASEETNGPGDGPEGSSAPDAESAPSDPCSGARVLIVDDEAPVANFLADALRAHGVTCEVAADGQAGLDAFLERTPDLVLCDLLIPKRNGFQLIEEFRRQAPSVPVVAMSGIYRREKYAEELAHAQIFLAKPIDLVHVQEIVALLERRLASRGVDAPRPSEPARPRGREPWIPLSVLPLPRMLHLLWADRRTGLLTLRAPERQIVFMIEEGRLRFVRTNEPELRLDRVLLQLGRVKPADLDAAQADLSSRTVPTRLGEVLVERGSISRAELDRTIQVQLRRIVASAFAEPAGETLFTAESIPAGEDVVIDSDLRSVIVAGCMSVRDAGDRLVGHLPDGACLLEACEGQPDPDLKLPLAVARLLEGIDEPTRLSDLAAMADLVGIRGRWLTFGLLCSDVLRISDTQAGWRGVAARPGKSRHLDLTPLEALLELESAKATGVLRASWGDTTASLALQEGRIVQGASSDARTRIGGLLRSAGLLSPDQLASALREQASKPGRPLGHVLVEMGLLSAATLRTAIPAQVQWVARDMAGRAAWDEASFAEDEAPEREPLDIPCTISELVVDTLRELDEKSLFDIVATLAAGRAELDLESLRGGRFQLSESEQLVAEALSPETAPLLRALTGAERMDPELLRVLVLALLSTAAPTPGAPSGTDDLVLEVIE